MTCRVCSGASPVGVPCYTCMTLLAEYYGKYTLPEIREKAAAELYERVDKANNGGRCNG